MLSCPNLWANHPNIKGEEPLLDKRAYQNQCAINLFAALERSGVNFKNFRDPLSWQNDKPKYAIRAQELADWLALPFSMMSKVEKFSGNEAFEKIGARRWIVFFQNYWGLGRQGDYMICSMGRE